MTVRKRKDGRWQCSFQYGPPGARRRFKRACVGARNRSEALDWEARKREELERGAIVSGVAPLFRDFAEEFLETYAASNNKPSERGSKRTILDRHLLPEFGTLRLDTIGARQIEAFKARKMNEGLSPKTINNILTVLRKVLSTAKDYGMLAAVPTVRWMRVEAPGFKFLTAEEGARLVAAATAGVWRAMILIALRTGLRMGELIALRWSDVDLEAGRFIVRRSVTRGIEGTPKGHRSREVPLSDEAIAALRELQSGSAGELVFPGEGGGFLTKGQMRHPLWRACDRAGLPRMGWHACRHSTASQLVMAGVPIRVVQSILGHTDVRVTERYSHLTPTVRRDAVAMLDSAPARTEARVDHAA